MNRERTDLDVPEGTVRPATESADELDPESAIELGPGTEQPRSLDPDRDDPERNAASGGWDGANEQIENDFETEQLHRAEREKDAADNDEADEDLPLT